jgi:hypothetical protein
MDPGYMKWTEMDVKVRGSNGERGVLLAGLYIRVVSLQNLVRGLTVSMQQGFKKISERNLSHHLSTFDSNYTWLLINRNYSSLWKDTNRRKFFK